MQRESDIIDFQDDASWLAEITEAPIYRPSAAEFADPLRYIASIQHKAAVYGVSKLLSFLLNPQIPVSGPIESYSTRIQH